MTEFAAGLTNFLQQDPIAEMVRALDDPFQAEGVPGRVRDTRRLLDKAPADKRAQMQSGLDLLAELYGAGLGAIELGGQDAAAVRGWLERAYETWRASRTGADRAEVAKDAARALAGREDGAARLQPFFSGWGGEPRFAAQVLAEWPRLDAALTGAAERALGLLGLGEESWPQLSAGHGVQRARVGGGAALAVPDAGGGSWEGTPVAPRLAELRARRASRAEAAGLLVELGATGASAAFAEWEKTRQLQRLAAALRGLPPFARDEARTRQVVDLLAAATRVLEDEQLPPERQAEVPDLVQAAMSAIVSLGRRLKPDPALAAIKAAEGALLRLSPAGLAAAVEARLAEDATLAALASLQPAVVLEQLVARVDGALLLSDAPGGPGFARAVGALLGGDAPGARGERLAKAIAWLQRGLQGSGRARVLAAQALWDALDRCVLAVGTSFARTWFAGTTGSGAPPLRFVALAALDVVVPQGRLDPARFLEPADRLLDKVRTRAAELAARPAQGEATRRGVLLWLEATAALEREALEAAAEVSGWQRRPLAARVVQLVGLFVLLRGDVLPPPRVEAAGLSGARALYAPDPEAEQELATAAIRGLDADRWATFARVASGARGQPALLEALFALAARLRPGRPGDEPGASRSERAERELSRLLALVAEDLPDEAQARLGEGIELALARGSDAARERGQAADPLRSLGRVLLAHPGALLVGWTGAASADPALRDPAARLSAWMAAVQAGREVKLELPQGPVAAAFRAVEEAELQLVPPAEGQVVPRKRLVELGQQVKELARATGELGKLLGREDGRPADAAVRAAGALSAQAELPLLETAGRGALLRSAEFGLREVAGLLRVAAPAPEHRRAAERLEAWARRVAAHRELFVDRVEQLLRARRLEPLLELGWDDPADLLRAGAGALSERPGELLAFLGQLAARRTDFDAAGPAAQPAWEAVRRGFVRERDFSGLLDAMVSTPRGPLAWTTEGQRERLLELARRELSGDPEALRRLLARMAAAPGGDRDTPGWRAAHAALIEGLLARGDLPAMAAHMSGPDAGALRWSRPFTAFHQTATNPVSLVVAAAPFAAARWAEDALVVTGGLVGLLGLYAAFGVWMLLAPAHEREGLLPGAMARVGVPLVALATLGQLGLYTPMGGWRLLALVGVCAFAALWLLVADRGWRAALASFTLAAHHAFALGLALMAVLLPAVPWGPAAGIDGAYRFQPAGFELAFFPGLLAGWVALSVLVGAALERASRR